MAKYTVGITGGIGAGKSVVSRVLRCNGFYVYDCDAQAKIIMTKDINVKRCLTEKLGNQIYTDSGKLNRKYLASLIFNDENTREFVNSVVHRAVKADIESIGKGISDIFFVESAIISSSGLSSFCDEIWIIEASEEERYKRIFLRDNLEREEIFKRIESQNRELSLLKNDNIIYLYNDNFHPLILKILSLTNKYINNQKYYIPC